MSLITSSSNGGEPSHDYTEGATFSDIGEALDNNRRERRNSQHSTGYDVERDTAMFSGPGHTVNPSSVSRMTYMELGRKSSDMWTRSRRKSVDSRSSHVKRRASLDSTMSPRGDDRTSRQQDEGVETELLLSRDVGRSRRRSPSPQPRSVFENLANIFGRASAEVSHDHISERSSTSRFSRRTGRSDGSEHGQETEEDEEERWGYSSGEEGDSDSDITHPQENTVDNASIAPSMDYDSEPPSPFEATQTLPLLGFDSAFDGEARIDMDTTFTLLDPPPLGPPSRQTVYISDEDTTIRFIGYQSIPWRVWAWRISCISTLGIIGLIGHWFPYLWLRWVAKEKAFINTSGGFVMVEVRTSEFSPNRC